MGRDQTDGQRRKDGTVPSSGTAQRVPGCGAAPHISGVTYTAWVLGKEHGVPALRTRENPKR